MPPLTYTYMSSQATRPSLSMYITLAIIILIALAIDFYVYEGVKVTIQGLTTAQKKLVAYFYWGITGFTLGTFLVYIFFNLGFQGVFIRRFIMPLFFISCAI